MLRLKPYLLAFLISSCLLIASCGQSGDLYLPEDEPEKSTKEKSKK